MNNKIWFVLLAISSAGSYLLGYNMSNKTPVSEAVTHTAVQASNVSAQITSVSTATTPAIQHPPTQKTYAIANAPETIKPNVQQSNKHNPLQIAAQDSELENQSSEISDEEIDKIVPAPFNMIAKGKKGGLREGFRKFADTAEPSTSDANLANKMTDFILSHPRAQAIHLDSVICKAELCEIRLFEIKNGTWSVIFSEMALQDWWGGLANSESVNFPTQFSNQTVSGIYMLFQRIPQIATIMKAP